MSTSHCIFTKLLLKHCKLQLPLYIDFQPHKHRHTQSGTHRHTISHTWINTIKDTHIQSHMDTHNRAHTYIHTWIHTIRDTHIQPHMDTHNQTQTHTQSGTDRHTYTYCSAVIHMTFTVGHTINTHTHTAQEKLLVLTAPAVRGVVILLFLLSLISKCFVCLFIQVNRALCTATVR